MNYAQISPETIGHIYKAHASLSKAALPIQVRSLVELRTSQINGCAYCCALHAEQARGAGVSQSKLDRLPGWRSSDAFDDREKLALEWCESVTGLIGDHDRLLTQMTEAFTEREIVDLTSAIALMSALNRLAITIGDKH